MRYLASLFILSTTLGSLATAQELEPERPMRMRSTPLVRSTPRGDQQLGGGGATLLRGNLPLDGGEWATVHDSASGGIDLGYSVAIDELGDVYVAGETESQPGNWDVYLAKFDRHGQFLWERVHAGSGAGRDYAASIAVDGDGAVLVAAVTRELGTGNDLSLLKYGSDGTLLWTRSYNGPANGSDTYGGRCLVLDAAGTAYVCGTSWGGATSYDSVALAYSTDGALLWEDRFDGPASAFDDAYAIAIDGAGGLYVGGDSTDVTTDFQVLKYSTGGALLWQATYDGPDGGSDLLYDIAAVGDLGVAVTGISPGAGTSSDYATVRFDAAGNQLWAQRFDGWGHGYDLPYTVAADAGGRVAVAGASASGVTSEMVTLLYGPNGTQLWSQSYYSDSGWGASNHATHVFFDTKGNVHVVGRSGGGPPTGDDGVALTYALDGTLEQELRYDSPTHGSDWLISGATDVHGNLVAAGVTMGPQLDVALLVLKLQ